MKIKLGLALGALICVSLFSLSCARIDAGSPDEVGVIETNYGRIVVEFYLQDTPRHVANFKKLAREGFYDGTKIFRVVKNKEVTVAVQGGDPNTISGDPATWGQGQPGQPTVPAEFSKRLHHARGALSAARRGDDENSHTSQFFICASNYLQWDGKYTVFGNVIEGMNVVDSIGKAPLWKGTDKPMDPVVVHRIYIAKRDEIN